VPGIRRSHGGGDGGGDGSHHSRTYNHLQTASKAESESVSEAVAAANVDEVDAEIGEVRGGANAGLAVLGVKRDRDEERAKDQKFDSGGASARVDSRGELADALCGSANEAQDQDRVADTINGL